MMKVLISIISFGPYHILEVIFSRLNLRLSQKKATLIFNSELKCALEWFRSEGLFYFGNIHIVFN